MAKELAAICETSERTIYRDLEAISCAKIPITNEGKGKGYKFIGDFKQHPLNWDEDEFYAFSLLPLLLEEKYQTAAFRIAYEKVMAAHSVEKKEREALISNISKVIQSGQPSGTTKENKLMPLLSDAILSMRTIEAIYHTQSRNTTTKRKIDPYFLIPRKSRLYIIGYCHKNNDIRTFRLSRFQSVKITNQKFTRDNISLERYLQYTWSVIRGDKKIDFKVKFSKNLARYIKEEDFNVPPKLTDLQDGSLVLEITLNDEREFLRWVMQYGPEAEILEPKIYREELKALLQKWSKIWDTGTGTATHHLLTNGFNNVDNNSTQG